MTEDYNKTALGWAKWLDSINHIEGSYATSNGAMVIRTLHEQLADSARQLAHVTAEREIDMAEMQRAAAQVETLTQRAEQAEAQLAALRAALEQLAGRWKQQADGGIHELVFFDKNNPVKAVLKCADELRALLTATPQEQA